MRVSGAKNAALPILAASLLASGTLACIATSPSWATCAPWQSCLRMLGAEVDDADKPRHRASVDTTKASSVEAPYELVKTMRALGAGARAAGRALRPRARVAAGRLRHRRAPDRSAPEGSGGDGRQDRRSSTATSTPRAKRLRGATIVFDMPTVTGTENLMMAAALAKGRTDAGELRARARGRGAGARAQQDGRARSRAPARRSSPSRASTSCSRSSTPSSPIASRPGRCWWRRRITRGDVLVRDCLPEHLDAVIAKLRARRRRGRPPRRTACACAARASSSRSTSRRSRIPGFPPTCRRSSWCWRRARAGPDRCSPRRSSRTATCTCRELQRMGADIHVEGRTAVVRGADKLTGADGDGDRSARVGVPGAGRRWSPRARPRCCASTTSTAATTDSRRSCGRSAPTCTPGDPCDARHEEQEEPTAATPAPSVRSPTESPHAGAAAGADPRRGDAARSRARASTCRPPRRRAPAVA